MAVAAYPIAQPVRRQSSRPVFVSVITTQAQADAARAQGIADMAPTPRMLAFLRGLLDGPAITATSGAARRQSPDADPLQ